MKKVIVGVWQNVLMPDNSILEVPDYVVSGLEIHKRFDVVKDRNYLMFYRDDEYWDSVQILNDMLCDLYNIRRFQIKRNISSGQIGSPFLIVTIHPFKEKVSV